MKAYRQIVRSAAWLLVTVSGMSCLAQGTAPPTPSSMEAELLRMTNAARSAQGLGALRWDETLAQAARTHANLLVQAGELSHQLPGEADLAVRAAQTGAHFQTIAENIADGPNMNAIQDGWMHSPPHRANILDPNLNAVGFAVVEHGNYFYSVADFSHSVPALSFEQVEAMIGKLLSARGIPPNGAVQDARQTCEMSHGAAGGSRPRFVMRWQGSDLTRLPSQLEELLRTRDYSTAAVGACSSANAESGFTTYRVAVLLY